MSNRVLIISHQKAPMTTHVHVHCYVLIYSDHSLKIYISYSFIITFLFYDCTNLEVGTSRKSFLYYTGRSLISLPSFNSVIVLHTEAHSIYSRLLTKHADSNNSPTRQSQWLK